MGGGALVGWRWLRAWLLLVTLVFGSLLPPADSAFARDSVTNRLTPQERRGKQIYLKGTSPSGQEIKAVLGDDSLAVPASTMPCASCHGYDGLGRPEGGVAPSNVTWDYLTKSYGHVHPSGRQHPVFTEQTLARAITEGIDPAGNKLLVAMPTYQLSRADLSDLLAYLKRIGEDRDPGLTETAIKIGTVLPADQSEVRAAVKALLSAYFEELNSQGGIYSRKLELHAVETSSVANLLSQTRRLLDEEQVFALTGAFIGGAEKELAALMETEEAPLIGPVTLYPVTGFPLNRQVFYLYAGLKEQSLACLSFAAKKLSVKHPRVAVIYPTTAPHPEIGQAIGEQCEKDGWNPVLRLGYSRPFETAAVAKQLAEGGADLIMFLGTGTEGVALMKEIEKTGRSPYFFTPGPLAGREIFAAPISFKNRIFLSYPNTPASHAPAGVAEFGLLADKYRLATKHAAVQFAAFCAAKILVEGLKLSGRELSREKLITALEGLYEFETGLSPKITYGPNRRIGALGAYIVALDLEQQGFSPNSEWFTTN